MSHANHWALIVILSSLLVTGCQPMADDPSPSSTANVEDAGAEQLDPEFIPERVPGGSARENQPHIDYVLTTALDDVRPDVQGRDLVASLVEAGYAQDDMELTPDASLVELPADSTALSVRFGEECLIAQWGSDWYTSAVEPVLASDTCLLGETVSLD